MNNCGPAVAAARLDGSYWVVHSELLAVSRVLASGTDGASGIVRSESGKQADHCPTGIYSARPRSTRNGRRSIRPRMRSYGPRRESKRLYVPVSNLPNGCACSGVGKGRRWQETNMFKHWIQLTSSSPMVVLYRNEKCQQWGCAPLEPIHLSPPSPRRFEGRSAVIAVCRLLCRSSDGSYFRDN